jgi:hypothetical protein
MVTPCQIRFYPQKQNAENIFSLGVADLNTNRVITQVRTSILTIGTSSWKTDCRYFRKFIFPLPGTPCVEFVSESEKNNVIRIQKNIFSDPQHCFHVLYVQCCGCYAVCATCLPNYFIIRYFCSVGISISLLALSRCTGTNVQWCRGYASCINLVWYCSVFANIPSVTGQHHQISIVKFFRCYAICVTCPAIPGPSSRSSQNLFAGAASIMR